MGSLSESLPPLLAATVAFAIGTSVLLRDRRRDDFLLFAIFCFNLGLFHLAWFFFHFTDLTIFEWLAQSVGLLLPWTADRCFASLIPHVGPHRRHRLQSLALTVLLVAQLVALVRLFTGDETSFGTLVGVPWRILSIGLDIYVIVMLLFVARRMWHAAKKAEGTALAPRMRYLLYASLTALALGSPWIPAVGPIITAAYLYFVAQALVRERLLDLPEILSRMVTLTGLIGLLTALYGALLMWIPGDADGRVSLMAFNIAVGSYAVIVLIDPVRTEFETWIGKLLFRERSQLKAMLMQLRRRLMNAIDPADMVTELLTTLKQSDRVTRASVYLLDNQGSHLILSGELGIPPKRRIDIATRRPLLERMANHGYVVRDVIQREYEREERETQAELGEVVDGLTELGAGVGLAIMAHTEVGDPRTKLECLVGALFIDDERLLEPFSSEEIELFVQLAAQAAITLQNSAAYEQRKERDRLAALGEMSAGLAHEIRNPLGAIRGAVQVVQPLLAGDDQTGEFMQVIVEEVDRLNRVVTQFLSYSRRYKIDFEAVDLPRVIEATCRLLAPDVASCVTWKAAPDLPQAPGDAEALRQVLHNLVLNALDAASQSSTPPKVVIEASVRRRGLPSGDAVAVCVRDNGPGLSPHTLSHLFVPFHTTKSGGTGLGLPICQRIIENHHGVIEATNSADGGACFTVVLPLMHPENVP